MHTIHLARAARDGDAEAYARLIVEHRDHLFAVAFSRTGHREDALDAVQDAVLAGLRSVGSLRDPEAFLGWMEAIVVRSAAAVRDRSLRCAAERRPEYEPPTNDPDVVAGLWLEQVLSALPEPHSDALWRFYCSGMSVAEIAAALGRPSGTIKRWLSEARRLALRRMIEMAATVCVVGSDLSHDEVRQIEEAAGEHHLMCERIDDAWAAHRWISDNASALVVVAKRLDGPCDAFTLIAMMKHGREPDLSGIPVVLLGPGTREYASTGESGTKECPCGPQAVPWCYAAWCAGVDCYLTRPVNPNELGLFIGRLLKRGEPQPA